MTLSDPRAALADQSEFVDYLVGFSGVAHVVHTLAADGDRRPGGIRDADDFVHVLLGLASIGAGIERLIDVAAPQQSPRAETPRPAVPTMRWLR